MSYPRGRSRGRSSDRTRRHVTWGVDGGIATAARVADPCPAVMVLANGDDPAGDALTAADPGVRVIHKPFRPTELVGAARQLVGSGPPPS